MKTTDSSNSFDAVNVMRNTRTKISQETEGMSFPELQRYMKHRLEASTIHPTPVTRKAA